MLAQSAAPTARTIPLASSKMLIEPVPGSPQKTNSLPMAIAISPDGRNVAVVNAGYGTAESKGEQSIAILDAKSHKLLDFPNPHTRQSALQTLYSGIAFGSDGQHLYVSIASLTHPLPDGKNAVGNGILVYRCVDGRVTEEKILPIPLQHLADGKRQNRMGAHPLPAGEANPYPSGLTVVHGRDGDRLLIADNLSDDALLMDATSGKILYRFDLSTSRTIPASYPIATAASPDGKRGFVALWNASEVAELDLQHGKVVQMLPLLPPRDPIDPSSHPAALVLNEKKRILYVALANRDSVAAIAIGRHAGKHGSMHTIGYFDTRLPGQTYFGAFPNALALSPDGNRLYAADASLDAVAVFNPHSMKRHSKDPIHPHGFIPTEWYPTALAATADELYVATGKGEGTGPNNFAPKYIPPNLAPSKLPAPPHTYIASLLYGSLAAMYRAGVDQQLEQLSNQVIESNRMQAAQQQILFRAGGNPIRHVIYIIKENRSYDQVFGDLNAGDRDPSLTMYGWSITPNEHKLAEQFGILDNF
ncbi:MAG: phosphoesterase, partial [Acidobacteriaceae bacterium]